MKFRIERGKRDRGTYIKFYVNDIKVERWVAARQMTGTTCEEEFGVLSDLVKKGLIRIDKGHHKYHFEFEPLNLMYDTPDRIRSVLRRRLNMVQTWINTLDRHESIEMKFTDPTAYGYPRDEKE